MFVPETLNLELTTMCPLRCPQCYCNLDGGRHLNLETAKNRIEEGARLGTKILLLSGGETLCYPHLYELIEFAKPLIAEIKVALSGVLFDANVLNQLISCGVTEISISLNGSTDPINSQTRDGYQYAIDALECLRDNGYPNTIINWVMHSSNSDDFPQMIELAEHYHVKGILIIGVKPDSSNLLETLPTRDQMRMVSSLVKSYQGQLNLLIESCYSNMLAYHLDTRLFGNLNVTDWKGCGAGRNGLSIDVDGRLTPCRHINIREDIDNMEDYWERSEILKRLRDMENDMRTPCNRCKYQPFCRHCAAINWNINKRIYIGFDKCPMFERCDPVDFK